MTAGRTSSRAAWLGCLLLLCVGVAANYEHVWREPAPQKLLGAGDSNWYFGPQSAFMDWSLARGELPEWSPLAFCGQPFAGNPQSGVLYPPNLLRGWLTPAPTPLRTHLGIAILLALHVVAAGLGTFALARAHGLTPGASMVAAWGFAFSASFVRRVVGNQFLGVVTWLPFILLFVRRMTEVERPAERLRSALAAGVLFGLSLLGGFPQLSVYMGVGLGAYVLTRSLLRTQGRARRALGDLALLGLVALIGALLASPLLLPAAEFIARCTRTDPGVGPIGSPDQLSQFPGFGALLTRLALYPGSASFALDFRAAGAGILLLALLGTLHGRRRPVVALVVLFLVFLDCSMGAPFPVSTLLDACSPSRFINPSRGFLFACLPLALLAGFGVDALGAAAPAGSPGASRTARSLRSASAAALAGVLVFVLARGLGGPDFLERGVEIVVVPALLGVLLVARPWVPAAWARVAWAPLIVLLVAGETVLWNVAFVPHLIGERGYGGRVDELREPQRIPLDNRRYSFEGSTELVYALRPTMNGYDPLHLARTRRVLCGPGREHVYKRIVERDEVTADNQRGNLFLKRPFWLARQFVRTALPEKDELFPVATTVFLTTGATLSVPETERSALPASSVSPAGSARRIAGPAELEWRLGRRERNRRLLIEEFDVPAAHSALVLRYRSSEQAQVSVSLFGRERSELGCTLRLVPTGDETALAEVPLPDLGPMRAGLTLASEAGSVTLLEAVLRTDALDEDERIAIRDWGANSVTLDVGPLDEPRLLTFVDAQYPGWSATVDGQPVPIHLANDAFKAVEVPPGTHQVRFVYASARLRIGLAVCLATLAGCAALLARLRRGRGSRRSAC